MVGLYCIYQLTQFGFQFVFVVGNLQVSYKLRQYISETCLCFDFWHYYLVSYYFYLNDASDTYLYKMI